MWAQMLALDRVGLNGLADFLEATGQLPKSAPYGGGGGLALDPSPKDHARSESGC